MHVIVNDFSLEARIGHDGPIDLNGLTIKLCGQSLGHIPGNTVLPSPDPVNVGRMPSDVLADDLSYLARLGVLELISARS